MAVNTVKFLRAMTTEDKQPKQVHDMVNAAVKAEKLNVVLSLAEAVALVEPALTTRQPAARILGYYLKAMTDAGLIEVEKAAAKPKLTDEEKAAKAIEKAAAKAAKPSKKQPVANVADDLGEDPAEAQTENADATAESADL